MSSDDAAGILLRFDNGARGVVTISQVSAGRKNSVSIEVDGSESALSWFSENPDHLWVGHRGRANEILQRDPSLASPDAARVIGYPGGHVEGYPDTFRALFAEVYADVANGGPSDDPTYPTPTDTMRCWSPRRWHAARWNSAGHESTDEEDSMKLGLLTAPFRRCRSMRLPIGRRRVDSPRSKSPAGRRRAATRAAMPAPATSMSMASLMRRRPTSSKVLSTRPRDLRVRATPIRSTPTPSTPVWSSTT